MLKRNTLLAAAVAAIITVLVTASTYAFPTTNYNKLTFSKAVGLPGVTLPAGSYRFEIANPEMNRDIVRVSDHNTGRVYYTGFTRRVRRPRGTTQIVTFGEAQDGRVPPINVWYPIDSNDGRQFVY
jgi:hypothetical protein